jgi:hypothetical protein
MAHWSRPNACDNEDNTHMFQTKASFQRGSFADLWGTQSGGGRGQEGVWRREGGGGGGEGVGALVVS